MGVKNILSVVMLLLAVLVSPSLSLAQISLDSPTKDQLEATIGAMGLSMEQKLALRSILQGLRSQGEKVQANGSLSDDQKISQVTKLRQTALGQTEKILSAPQQKQLSALLLPN